MTQPSFPGIDPAQTLRTLVAHCPDTRAILSEYGMDACCGGDLTIEAAARAHQVPMPELLARLAGACTQEPS